MWLFSFHINIFNILLDLTWSDIDFFVWHCYFQIRMHSSRMRTTHCSGRISCPIPPFPLRHACPPLPRMHPRPRMPPGHAHPPAMHAPQPCMPPVNRVKILPCPKLCLRAVNMVNTVWDAKVIIYYREQKLPCH